MMTWLMRLTYLAVVHSFEISTPQIITRKLHSTDRASYEFFHKKLSFAAKFGKSEKDIFHLDSKKAHL